ncbi:MAG: V-type ATP synthase subunit I [Bacteroidales bacterium]|nr:V-type ATP synthase subunit I [Bacteroidales bacterium]
MKKYAFLVYHADYEAFLQKVREIGVVQVVESGNETTDTIQERYVLSSRISDLVRMLKARKQEPRAPEKAVDGIELINRLQELKSEQEKLTHHIAALNKEIAQAEPWGDFSPQLLSSIAKAGYKARFFSCPERKFDESWNSGYYISEISRKQSIIYFVLFQEKDQVADIDAEEMRIPEHSVNELLEHRLDIRKKLAETGRELDEMAALYLPDLEKAKTRVLSDAQYESVLLNTLREADDKLMILNGFVPETGETVLKSWLDETGYVYYTERPVPDDHPPVLLKNSRFAKLFEPIGSLFSLPSYNELDLTPFFAPFFMMFFGFCMGDVGYGLLLVLVGIFMKKRVAPAIRPFLTLAVYLGIATMFFGVVTGTIAGFEMEKIPMFGALKGRMRSDQQIFYLALAIGLFQILFGLGIQAYSKYKQFGFAYAVSPLGIIIGVLALLDIALIKQGGIISKIFLYISLGMIVLWSDPNLGIFGRLGKGVWDLYGIITGIFGDTLSYIRLFALGASSGILGFVINSISLPLLDSIPVLGPILFVIVMVVGHGANLMLAGLGSFVHPMRLTFVEFYKNAGFIGGGKKYKPFSKNES